MQNLKIKLNDYEVPSINDYYSPYKVTFFMLKLKRKNNLILEGINLNDGTIRASQVKASDHAGTDEEKAIVAAYGNTFCIPLGKMF